MRSTRVPRGCVLSYHSHASSGFLFYWNPNYVLGGSVFYELGVPFLDFPLLGLGPAHSEVSPSRGVLPLSSLC